MEAIKFVQSWNPMAGRKQEYATFITGELQPGMKSLNLEVVSGWYTLMGEGPHVVMESAAQSLSRVESALRDRGHHEMLRRFMNLVTGYSSGVFEPTGWETWHRGAVASEGAVKFVQSWNILSGEGESYDCFLQDIYLPYMKGIGLEVASGWHLMVGSGPQIHAEAIAPDLVTVSKALGDPRYLELTVRMEELVTNLGSRVMVRHRAFLDMLHDIYGRAIRSVEPDEMNSMVGPFGD